MWHLQRAELRDSWPAWAGVAVGFVALGFTLALSAMVQLTGVVAVRSGALDFWQSAAFTFGPASNLLCCALVGAAVIGSSTGLVVDSRQGSLARLALAGATPAQVVSTVMTQLVVVSLACSLVGDALALLAFEPVLHLLAADPGEPLPTPTPVYAAWPVLLANLFAVGLALAAGLRQARRASRLPPVAALRQAGTEADEPMTVGRWVGSGVCLVLIALAYATIPAATAEPTSETFSNLVLSSVGVLVVGAVLLARLAPLLVGPVTRAWTRLLPTGAPSWYLARSTAAARGARLTRSVVPVMMAVGLLVGMVAIGQTVSSSLLAGGYGEAVAGTGAGSMLTFLGLPLLVALAGGVGSLVMMARQRQAELALCGIVGTTPGQRLAMPVFEGVIIAVTGALLSLAMVAAAVVLLAVGLPAAGFPFAFVPAYGTFAAALGACTAVTVAATVLPTLPSLGRPEPRVIARLVAE